MSRNLALALAALLLVVAATASAHPSFFTSRCAGCHSDDTPTCNGCHNHRGNVNATANADAYGPGDPVSVTLTGGQEHGWIRGILYDQNDLVVALATGPTGMGDDSAGDAVTFPVTLQAAAPASAGSYVWEAAWFGGATAGGGEHLEDRDPVTITVDDTNTGIGIPDETTPYSAIKALY